MLKHSDDMAYTLIEQQTRDIDWFILNFKTLNFCHFASAGGKLPQIIQENDLLNEEFIQIINGFEFKEVFEYEINPYLTNIINFEGDESYADYTRDFINYAKLGFYSYDKTNINEFNDMTYHLVAYPKDFQRRIIEERYYKLFEKSINIIINNSNIPFYRNENNKPFRLNID